MTPDKLQKLGEAIYGLVWQSALSRGLEINIRTVQRWASGEHAIPDGLEGELIGLVEEKIDYLAALVEQHKLAEKL